MILPLNLVIIPFFTRIAVTPPLTSWQPWHLVQAPGTIEFWFHPCIHGFNVANHHLVVCFAPLGRPWSRLISHVSPHPTNPSNPSNPRMPIAPDSMVVASEDIKHVGSLAPIPSLPSHLVYAWASPHCFEFGLPFCQLVGSCEAEAEKTGNGCFFRSAPAKYLHFRLGRGLN